MNRWRLLRFEAGLTKSELAARAGLSRKTIAELENGREPTGPTVKKLADAYGKTVAELVTEREAA